jgi:DNA-binding response OmpR family regulator
MDILVVDDEPATLRLTCFVLEQAGYRTRRASNGRAAIESLQEQEPDLVVMDVTMPEMSGFETCQQIRRSSNVPVVFVSACNDLQDRVRGLQVGGDDYVLKPYEPEELVARVQAVLRRIERRRRRANPLQRGEFTLDPVAQVVIHSSSRTSGLTPIEFRLLYYLMQNAGRVLRTTEILSDVWGYTDDSGRNLVAVYIRRLRSKIEPTANQPRHIKTVSNLGYRFEA